MEFALLMPFFIAMASFLIEMCLYWDATVMANHTAFTLARIAKVNVKRETDETYKANPHVLQKQKIAVEMPKVQSGIVKKILPTLEKSENLVTVMMMATATMGFAPAGEHSAGDLRQEIKDLISKFIHDMFPRISPLNPGDSNPFTAVFYPILNSIIDFINTAITSVADTIADTVVTILDPFIDFIFERILKERGARLASQIYTAHQSITTHKDVIKIDTLKFDASGLTLKYPQHYNTKKLAGTQIDKALHVSIHFPLTTNWIYSYFLSDSPMEKPRAHGHAIMMPEPVLTEVHLAAEEKAVEPKENTGDEDYETKYAEYAFLRRELPKTRAEITDRLELYKKAIETAKRKLNAVKEKQEILKMEEALKEHPDDTLLSDRIRLRKEAFSDNYPQYDYNTLDASESGREKAEKELKEAEEKYKEESSHYEACRNTEFELWKWNWDRIVLVSVSNGSKNNDASWRQVLIGAARGGKAMKKMLERKNSVYYSSALGRGAFQFRENDKSYIYSIPLAGGYEPLHECCYQFDPYKDWGGWCWERRIPKDKVGKWAPVAPGDHTFPPLPDEDEEDRE